MPGKWVEVAKEILFFCRLEQGQNDPLIPFQGTSHLSVKHRLEFRDCTRAITFQHGDGLRQYLRQKQAKISHPLAFRPAARVAGLSRFKARIPPQLAVIVALR